MNPAPFDSGRDRSSVTRSTRPGTPPRDDVAPRRDMRRTTSRPSSEEDEDRIEWPDPSPLATWWRLVVFGPPAAFR
jgi:hypothetical protein